MVLTKPWLVKDLSWFSTLDCVHLIYTCLRKDVKHTNTKNFADKFCCWHFHKHIFSATFSISFIKTLLVSNFLSCKTKGPDHVIFKRFIVVVVWMLSEPINELKIDEGQERQRNEPKGIWDLIYRNASKKNDGVFQPNTLLLKALIKVTRYGCFHSGYTLHCQKSCHSTAESPNQNVSFERFLLLQV